MNISNELKKECLRRKAAGQTYTEIYNTIGKDICNASKENFSRMMRKWAHKINLDEELLDSANLNFDFKPYASSVHVNGKGEVIGAWIKQSAIESTEAWREFIMSLLDKPIPTYRVEKRAETPSDALLEIPLFDMHFGIADMDHYAETLNRIISLVNARYYDEIVIVIGQDLLHNDDFRGRTSKGTPIDKVDMIKAWSDADTFFTCLIKSALKQSNRVRVIYSKGNHDESFSWGIAKLLERTFPEVIFDTELKPRKAIEWKKCFIGWSHAEYAKSGAKDLFMQFAVEYPMEFANSAIREIHTGHLHKELGDDAGAMVRRLPTAAKTDDWSRDNGYIGAHKRFMLFVYEPERLSAIHYV